MPPQRQSIWPRVVVPCSMFKKVLLLVDRLFKQLPRNNYPTVCSLPLEGSRHELRRARGVQCRREDGDAVKSRQNVVPSFVTGRLWGFSFKGRAGGGRADGRLRTVLFLTGWFGGLLVQRSPFNTEHRGGDSGHHARNPINYKRF